MVKEKKRRQTKFSKFVIFRQKTDSLVPEGVSVNTRGPEIILGLMFRGMSEVSKK